MRLKVKVISTQNSSTRTTGEKIAAKGEGISWTMDMDGSWRGTCYPSATGAWAEASSPANVAIRASGNLENKRTGLDVTRIFRHPCTCTEAAIVAAARTTA